MLGKGAESLPLLPEGPRSGEGPRKAQLGWPEWGRAGGPHHLMLMGYTTALDWHRPGGLSSLRPLGLLAQEGQKRLETGKFQDPELTGPASGLRPRPGPHCGPRVGSLQQLPGAGGPRVG